MAHSADIRDELPPFRELTVDAFVARWQSSAASERSNYQLFLVELCEVLGLERPEPATGQPERDEYVFERPVCEAKQQQTILDQAGLSFPKAAART